MEETIKKYPSKCWTCKRARKPASNKMLDEGYVGCTLFTEGIKIPEEGEYENSLSVGKRRIVNNIKVKALYEGWVDLRAGLENRKGSGVTVNSQLLTVEVVDCKFFNTINV